MKKSGMIALWIMFMIVLAPYAAVQGGGGMENETVFNEEGLAHYNRAYYEFLASGKTVEAKEEFEKAASAFQEAIKLNDRFVEAHRNLGRLYTVQKKNDLAAEQYRTVVELEPGNLENYLPLASALERLGRFDEARDVLTLAKSLTGDPLVRKSLDKLIEKLNGRGGSR